MERIYKEGDSLRGFTCSSAEFVEDQNGWLYVFIHEPSGARLVWLHTSDDNKLFSVTFRTTPADSTGVFHILEHSVLCGSEKYPVKEPFVELLKSSMKTFLNAITFSDKTMYPVSSRNEKDFLNLTSVYLDAVFKPLIYTNPNIFYQEGWHYEYREEEEVPSFKGVVFNEMKGAASNLDERAEEELMKVIFRDNCYSANSGGDPECIPSLTYERFIDTHKRFYNASNAIFYLEGDMNPDKAVSLIMDYMPDERDSFDTSVEDQLPTAPERKTVRYPVTAEEGTEKKTRIVLGKLLCNFDEKEKLYAYTLIGKYLADSNSSPLKKALLDSGMVQDVSLVVEDGLKQCFLCLQLINTETENEQGLLETIRTVIDEILKQGLSVESLEANINEMEFDAREPKEPRGIIHNIGVMNSMLYGGEPSLYLCYSDVFRALRERLGTDYYSEMMKEMFSDLSEIVLLPDTEEGLRVENRERARLAEDFRSWTPEQKQYYLRLNRELDRWQQSEDTEDALSTIPKLTVEDVEKEPKKSIFFEDTIGGVKLLVHPCDSAGIVFLNLYFPLDTRWEKDLDRLAQFNTVFGLLPTSNRSLDEVINDTKMYLGGFYSELVIFSTVEDSSSARVYFRVCTGILEENLDKGIELLKDIVFNSNYGDTRQIKTLLLQYKEDLRNRIIVAGHSYGIKKAGAGVNPMLKLGEEISGITSYCRLKEFADNPDKAEETSDFMKKLSDSLFVKNDAMVSVSVDEKEADNPKGYWRTVLKTFTDELPEGENTTKEFTGTDSVRNTFIKIPSGVSYACSAFNTERGAEMYGKWQVASQAVSLAYLWNEVRVKGGAYGTGMVAGYRGSMRFYSYRDPDPANSFSSYRGSVDFLKSLANGNADVSGFIISTIGDSEPLRTPREQGKEDDLRYLRGMDHEYRCRLRAAVLDTKSEDMAECAKLLEKGFEKESKCLVGGSIGDFTADEEIVI